MALTELTDEQQLRLREAAFGTIEEIAEQGRQREILIKALAGDKPVTWTLRVAPGGQE